MPQAVHVQPKAANNATAGQNYYLEKPRPPEGDGPMPIPSIETTAAMLSLSLSVRGNMSSYVLDEGRDRPKEENMRYSPSAVGAD